MKFPQAHLRLTVTIVVSHVVQVDLLVKLLRGDLSPLHLLQEPVVVLQIVVILVLFWLLLMTLLLLPLPLLEVLNLPPRQFSLLGGNLLGPEFKITSLSGLISDYYRVTKVTH